MARCRALAARSRASGASIAAASAGVASVVMWLKRRPAGAARLAAPPRPDLVPLSRGMLLIALVMSMAFPVLGLTLLAVLAFDLLVLGAMPPLKRALS